MSAQQFILLSVILGIVCLVIKAVVKTTPHPQPEDPRTREQLRDLILGKAKRTVIITRGGFTTNEAENRVIGLKERYQFGKLFEMASKSPDNELKLANGDKIAPHSREHGLSSGRSADLLRIHIIKEYGIDIATNEDLELGDDDFIIQRKAELIAKIEKDMGKGPKGPDSDDDGLPKEG